MVAAQNQNFPTIKLLISVLIVLVFLTACDKKLTENTLKIEPTVINEKPVETTSTVAKTKFDQMLDNYEAIIVEYETIAKKEVICTDDWMNLLNEVNPKLLAMTEDMQASEKEAMNASPMWMQRYMELTMRYSKLTQDLSKKQPGSC